MDTSNIIKGVVNSGRYTVTAPIVKEDYGIYLQIEGVELPSTYEVDFSNSEHNGTSVTMIGNSDGVLIPHQFISTGKDIFAFLYHVGENFGRTVYKFRIPNKVRPDRTDDTPTPEQASVIDQAISALNTAVEKTAQDKADADVSAQNASADAERAEEARTDAQNYATQAEQSATDASQSALQASASATASAQSASQSAQIKTDVEGMVDDAQGYAQASAQSASQASASEQGCARAVLDAASAAAIARARADEASAYAQTASNKASEASTSAQTASTKASESAQSATNASQSAQTAEQAKADSQTAQGLAESARDLAQGYAEDAQGYANDAQASAESISASASQIAQNTADILKAFPTDTASGAVASFSDGADDIPLKSFVVNIDPVQDTSSGDPSPENICPISGWDGMNVRRTGKNLFGGLPMAQAIVNAVGNATYSKLVSDDTGDYVTVRASAYINRKTFTDGIKFKSNTPYTVILRITRNTVATILNSNIGVEYTDGTLMTINFTESTDSEIVTVVFVTDGAKTVKHIETIFGGGTSKLYYKQCGIFEGTLTADDFKSYTGQTIPISWQTEAGTVYGGKLDVLSGVLTVDRAMVDLGTLDWCYDSTSYSGWDFFFANLPTENSGAWNCGICSSYRLTSAVYARSEDKVFNMTTYHGYNTVNIRDTSYTDAASFKAAMNGVQLCYELATPIEIQLTPNQINSLYGQNNLWADSGDTTAEYRADTKLYISKKIAEAISALS